MAGTNIKHAIMRKYFIVMAVSLLIKVLTDSIVVECVTFVTFAASALVIANMLDHGRYSKSNRADGGHQ